MSTPCGLINKTVPYFKDWEEENNGRYEDIDAFLYYHLDILSGTPFDYSNRVFDDNEDVKALPDAVYKVYEANEKILNFDASVADHHIWQYHRENGFTKLGIREPNSGEI